VLESAPYPGPIVSSARRSAVKLNDCVERILRQKGSSVYSVAPHVTVYKALEMMADKDIGALVVMEGDDLVGLLSERDYVRKVILKGFSSKEITVDDIMSSPAVSVNLRTSVDECMRLMTDNRCRHLTVMEEGAVVGVVSIGDLVNWIITVQDLTIHQLEDYITGKYPA
jgi:CBS domain-containing protein